MILWYVVRQPEIKRGVVAREEIVWPNSGSQPECGPTPCAIPRPHLFHPSVPQIGRPSAATDAKKSMEFELGQLIPWRGLSENIDAEPPDLGAAFAPKGSNPVFTFASCGKTGTATRTSVG